MSTPQPQRLTHSQQDDPLPIERYNRGRNLTLKPFISACYAPFTSLNFSSTGQVQICGQNYAFPIGDIRTMTLKEIWTGPKIRQLREALTQNNFSYGCQGCELAIQRNSPPHALQFEQYETEALAAWPRIMQFQLSNTCNFGCIMCSDLLSSTIRQRIGKTPLPRVYGDSFFEELWEFLPQADELRFDGGEPLLIEENFRIWDQLFTTRNTRAHIVITTNGSVWNDTIHDYLDRLNLSAFLVSIDGATKSTFEAVRVGSDFERVMQNLKHYAKVMGTIRPRGDFGRRPAYFCFIYCLTPLNFHEMADVFLMAEDFGATVIVQVVTNPPQASFLTYQHTDIDRVLAELIRAYERIKSRLSITNTQRYLDATTTLLGFTQTIRDNVYTETNMITGKIRALDTSLPRA